MTTDEILAGFDRSLAAIATERERLIEARAQLTGPTPAPARERPQPTPRRSSRRKPGDTLKRVLEALDPTESRTAGDVDKIVGVGRPLVGSTLTRLVKQGLVTKAKRGYLRAAA
jgi:DNA-binding transcriptional ArsR family regulator